MENNKPVIFYEKNKLNSSSNQDIYQYSYLKDILNKQLQFSDDMHRSVTQFQSNLQVKTNNYENQLKNIFDHQQQLVNELQQKFLEQSKNLVKLQEKIGQLDDKYEGILTNLQSEKQLLEAILEQQVLHDNLLQKVTERKKEEEEIFAQLQQHDEHLKDFANKLDLQEVFHQTIMERFDSQEGLLQKLSGDLAHLRSIVYERSAYLLEKIETGFIKVAQPIHRFFIHGDKKAEKVKNDEI